MTNRPTPTPPSDGQADGPPRRRFLRGLGLIAVAGAAGVGVSPRPGGAIEAPPEGPTEVDIGFCTDMATHHVQALSMCQRVLGRDTGDAVQAAAAEVLQNQAIEVGMMRAWLTDWGMSTRAPEQVMAWMDMSGNPDGIDLADMPGYASREELTELSVREGLNQGRYWLELMRAHHEGGVHMAEYAAKAAIEPKVIRLAEQQVRTQSFEIDQYDLLLNGIYAEA